MLVTQSIAVSLVLIVHSEPMSYKEKAEGTLSFMNLNLKNVWVIIHSP